MIPRPVLLSTQPRFGWIKKGTVQLAMRNGALVIRDYLGNETTADAVDLTSGPVTSSGGVSAIANGAISNAMLANGAVANLSGTNTGDQTSVSGNAGTVTDIGNLTGVVTSTNRATAIADAALSIAKTSGLQAALDAKAADSAVVKLTGDQTINGIKTFQGGVVITVDNGLSASGDINFPDITSVTIEESAKEIFRLAMDAAHYVPAPANAGSAGTSGALARDSDYFYVCVATNTWKRVAISTW